MRKDLWIGGLAATLVHGTAVWFSLFQVVKPHVPASDDHGVLVPFTSPPPEEVEPPDVTDPEKQPPRDTPPSLPDIPSPEIHSPFVELPHPTPPDDPNSKPMTILPPEPFGPRNDGPPIFDPSQLSQTPVAISRTNPVYPYALRRDGVEGQVTVDFIVDEHGTVVRPYALEGARSEFAQSAVEGVRRWHFRPGIKDGRAVRTHMQIPLVFSINKDD